ncbi:hypothetical protein HYDPIDRAFT_25324 [Hydnomerulius pinastri MD-312]|nr:hypothetical protein HYDPIDRAFT_25324 [Hydnomerulius pinastri MD-312]
MLRPSTRTGASSQVALVLGSPPLPGAMEKLSDTVTSIFRIDIKDGRPTACSSGDSTVVYGDTFGLGWRFGISYNPHEWFAKVRVYLDHNHSHTEQDEAYVSIVLKDSDDKSAEGLKERTAKILDFGHGQPALLGSWSPAHLAAHPYVSITVSAKAKSPRVAADPLLGTAVAVKQSMESGDFVDTKFYVFSTKRPGTSAGVPRVVYANNLSLGLVLPKSTPGKIATSGFSSFSSQAAITGGNNTAGLAAPFLVNMTSDHQINENSMLHGYDYEQDSDLDEDEDEDKSFEHDAFPGKFESGPSSSPRGGVGRRTSHGFPSESEPPAYSVSTCPMVLVKGIAYRTWFSYIYYRYTGQVSFFPLKSQGPVTKNSPASDPGVSASCSPKSMYRLAVSVGDERLKELAFRSIRKGLSKDNIIEEAFSWFTAQYTDISKLEVDEVMKLRKSPEVSLALRLQLKAVSNGEKPWAHAVLTAIMDKLNPSTETSA